MNGKFIEKYGQAWAELNDDMKMMSIMSEIFDLREEMREFKDTCETVRKHVLYWRIALFVVTPIMLAIVTWMVSSILRLL